MMGMSASIVGATGLVGSEVISRLCNDVDFDAIHAFGRRPISGSAAAGSPKLRQQMIDFDRLKATDWPDCDVLFCCLGTTIKAAGSQAAFRKVDRDFVIASAQRAHQAGTRRLMVVSAMGADAHSRIFYNRVKGEMEAAVGAIGFETVGIFRPSLLAGERAEWRAGEHVALAALKFVNVLIPEKYRPVPASAVARCMISTAKSAGSGRFIMESDKIQAFA